MEIRVMIRLLAPVVILMVCCAPKTTQKTVVVEEKPEKQIDPNDPCRTWVGLPNEDAIIESHVLYRDFLKDENYDAAFPLWKEVFAAAPMADGHRNTHFEDGILLNYHYYQKTGDGKYKDEILNVLLPQMRSCAQNPGEAAGRQAFDLYYHYKDLATELEVYQLFKLALDESGTQTKAFVLNPFMKVLTDLYLKGEIPTPEAQKYSGLAKSAMENGLANCGENCESWDIVQGYLPSQLDRLESVKGFFDCDYYMAKYYTEFKSNPGDCDVVDNAHLRLKWGGCSPEDPKFKEIDAVKQTLCKPAPTGDPDLVEGRQCLEDGDYQCALQAYGRYVEKTDDLEKKARFTLRQGKIAYAHLKNYPLARKYALQASKFQPNWGDPYMLIGSLYASSGPLCGPGTGWDSQVVTWPAIDKWSYAKKVDPSVATEANRLISKYQKYMPSRGDIFQRGLKEGQSFQVNCWINEPTTIRAAID